jgi:hypothetical protein
LGEQLAFDPKEAIGWHRIREDQYQKLAKQGRPPFPTFMLAATPGQQIEQEWVL